VSKHAGVSAAGRGEAGVQAVEAEDSVSAHIVNRHEVQAMDKDRYAGWRMVEHQYRLFQNVPVEQGPCPEGLAPYYELCPGVFLAADRPES
jgi:hypothetical protein